MYTVDMGAFTRSNHGHLEYFTLRGFVATLWPWTAEVQFIKYACYVVVVVVTGTSSAALLRREGRLLRYAAGTLWLLAALLVSPMSEKHHLAWLVPALVVGVYTSIYVSRMRRCENSAWFATIVAAMFATKPWPDGPFYFISIAAVMVSSSGRV